MAYKNYKYGHKRDVLDTRDRKFRVTAPVFLPPLIDLRTSPFMPEIWDQGQIGSCVAHSTACIFNFEQRKQGSPDFMPSRLMIYYNARLLEGTVNEDDGCQIRDAIKALINQGVCDEKEWIYDTSKFAIKPPDSCYSDGSKHQVIQYMSVPQTLLSIKTALAQGYPISFGISVYESFESQSVIDTGIVPMPNTSREQNMGGHAICFTKDTKISLLNGTEKDFETLCNEYSDKKFYVYSCDDNGNIVPGLAHSPRKTGKNQRILKVTLDNDETIKCTEEHLFMLRDGTYKKAVELKENDSLMPLYRKKEILYGNSEYEMFLNLKNQEWYYTHRKMTLDNKFEQSDVIHHKDFNRLNNSPDNLIHMSWENHTKLHSENVKLLNEYAQSDIGRLKSKSLMKSLWANPQWKEKTILQNIKNGQTTFENNDKKRIIKTCESCDKQFKVSNSKINRKYCSKICSGIGFTKKLENDLSFKNKCVERAKNNLKTYNENLKSGNNFITDNQIKARRNNSKRLTYMRFYKNRYSTFEEYLKVKNIQCDIINHKVKSVEFFGYEDVYDLTVDKYHNFALSAGVFVHNCAVGYDDRKQVFICRNSWGKEVMMKGYFTLPYEFVTNPNLSSDFWVIQKNEI